MARTYCTTNNSRGTTISGMSATFAHLRGWDVGVHVTYAPEDGHDAFRIFTTGGSNDRHRQQHIGTVRLDEEGRPTFYFHMDDE